MARFPTYFFSHGAPDLVLHDVPARRFLDDLGRTARRPKAVLLVSAHFESETPKVTAMAEPRTIHDFHGFDARLYDMYYRAPGDPDLAHRIVDVLRRAGYDADGDHDWGLDHGAWTPLMRIFPDADIPVLALSINLSGDTRYHLALGRALSELPEQDVMVVGSGSFTHNLAQLRPPAQNAEPPAWAEVFVDWTVKKILSGDEQALLDYRHTAPHATQNHPSDEHFMPLYVAIGAAGESWRAERLHHSYTYGALAMDAFRFD